ncbi:protein singles bar [Agrilus planipennis]|uniref:Protein singles bar n=1 Tax=Agrilus planipennis TaxID=224129 RepID=A0A7F5RMQ8_AGRPL|nr:protein singles bar [Agrilus planipennis]
MRSVHRPTVITMRNVNPEGQGINCCCCRCCTCLNLGFMKTEAGVLKLIEIFAGLFCQTLAVSFGSNSYLIGASYQGFLTAVSWSMFTTVLLLICYIFSEKSVGLIKQSLFETAFNTVASLSYLSACSYLGFIVNTVLSPLYSATPFFQVYPAMTAAYFMGTIVGLIYGYDAYKSYQYFKNIR